MIAFVIVAWFVFAIVVGYAASRRGRLAFDWFVLALLISPPLAATYLYLRRIYLPLGVVDLPHSPGAAIPISEPFLPDDNWHGVPYRVLTGGYVDAILPGGVVRFRSIEQMKATVEKRAGRISDNLPV